jgi:hypothetical protein
MTDIVDMQVDFLRGYLWISATLPWTKFSVQYTSRDGEFANMFCDMKIAIDFGIYLSITGKCMAVPQ